MVEVTGLEPAASWSQTKHSTKLSYTSIIILNYTHRKGFMGLRIAYVSIMPMTLNKLDFMY